MTLTNWKEYINQPLKLENGLYAEINKIHDDGTMTGFYITREGHIHTKTWMPDGSAKYLETGNYNLVPPKRETELYIRWRTDGGESFYHSQQFANEDAKDCGGHVTGPYLLREDMKGSKEVTE